jgi:quercetin dioxygenase-like cupin family protein
MKQRIVSLFFCVSLAMVLAAAALAAGMSAAPTIVTSDSIKWAPFPGMKGVQTAVLFGDPAKAGSEYAMRYKLADGVKFPPHTHPRLEEVTVLSGTLVVGVGSKWDASKMKPLLAGAFAAIPAGLPHFAMSKGVTVFEIHGIGPDVINMVKTH